MPRESRGASAKGSRQMGRGCGVLFFGAFFVIGSVVSGGFIWQMLLPAWRANTLYVAHKCVVLDKKISESRGEDGPTYRPEIHIRYSVGGREYETWTYEAGGVYSSGSADKQKIIAQFKVGQEYPCWHDPADPAKAVLVRGYSWYHLFALMPLIFVAIGIGGMYFSVRGGKRPARRDETFSEKPLTADAVAAGLSWSSSTPPGEPSPAFPTVPTRDLSNSPGTTLKYRLSFAMSPGCALAGILGAAIFWNGITWLFVGLVATGKFAGPPQWVMWLFLTPFVLVGLVLVFAFFKQLLIATGVGPTVAEISDHPLRPGEAYQVFVSQSGNMQMNSLRVLLVCDESATYRQGTSTSTETKRVMDLELFRNEGFEIQKGLPYESRCELRVPPDAMHSFEESHNKIQWKLVVLGDVAGWPDFSRDFPLVVLPASAAGGDT